MQIVCTSRLSSPWYHAWLLGSFVLSFSSSSSSFFSRSISLRPPNIYKKPQQLNKRHSYIVSLSKLCMIEALKGNKQRRLFGYLEVAEVRANTPPLTGKQEQKGYEGYYKKTVESPVFPQTGPGQKAKVWVCH